MGILTDAEKRIYELHEFLGNMENVRSVKKSSYFQSAMPLVAKISNQ